MTPAADSNLVFIFSLLEAERRNYLPALHSIVKELFSMLLIRLLQSHRPTSEAT